MWAKTWNLLHKHWNKRNSDNEQIEQVERTAHKRTFVKHEAKRDHLQRYTEQHQTRTHSVECAPSTRIATFDSCLSIEIATVNKQLKNPESWRTVDPDRYADRHQSLNDWFFSCAAPLQNISSKFVHNLLRCTAKCPFTPRKWSRIRRPHRHRNITDSCLCWTMLHLSIIFQQKIRS